MDQERPSILEIIGREDKESDNSKLLAYLLDPGGNHRLDKCMLQSLGELYKAKGGPAERELLNRIERTEATDIKVQTEVSVVESKDRMDILVTGFDRDRPKWELIIENKIHAKLSHEQLKKYWKGEAKKWIAKYGAVLTLAEMTSQEQKGKDEYEHPFINITHSELLEKFRRKLEKREMCPQPDLVDEFISPLKKVIEREEKLSEFEEQKEELHAHFEEALRDDGFSSEPESSDKGKGRPFINKELFKEFPLRLYVRVDEVLLNQRIWGVIEIRDKEKPRNTTKKYGNDISIMDPLRENMIFQRGKYIREATGGGPGKKHMQLIEIDIPLESSEDIKNKWREYFDEEGRDQLKEVVRAFQKSKDRNRRSAPF